MQRSLVLLTAASLLSSCGSGPRPAKPEELTDIFGPMTATGVVADTPLSLYRRGTHALTEGGEERMYLESRDINLSEYVSQLVAVEGELMLNTHPSFLPVLLVSRVTVLEEGEEETPEVEQFSFPWGNLTVSFPRSWIAKQGAHGIVFLLEDEGAPFLTISEHDGQTLAGRGDTPLLIAGREARRSLDPMSGKHTVDVALQGGILRFDFTPQEELQDLRDAFYTLLRDVRIEEPTTPDEPLDAARGKESLGPPCGGPAGVLCPEGNYCRITDRELGIGRCIQL